MVCYILYVVCFVMSSRISKSKRIGIEAAAVKRTPRFYLSICLPIDTSIHMSIYIYICIYMYTYTYIYMIYRYTHIHIYIYMYICTYIYIYVYVYVYIYIYIYRERERSVSSSQPEIGGKRGCRRRKGGGVN